MSRRGSILRVLLLTLCLIIVILIMFSGPFFKMSQEKPLQPISKARPNCTLLFNGNKEEMWRVRNVSWPVPSDKAFYQQVDASNCDWIKKMLKGDDYYVSNEEKQFPLAFALSVYQSPYQIVRFLKVIYRSHNIYCLHYDQKSKDSFKKLMIALATCLPNVIVPKKTADVVWAWHTIVDAQMNCMEDLYALRNEYPWEYIITLCGKEVPLKTNREMVESLQQLNGSSAITVTNPGPGENNRWKFKYVLKRDQNGDLKVTQTNQMLDPFNLTIVKSMSYYGLSHRLVNYTLHSELAIKFRKFMDDTLIPDEHFISTLSNIPGVPGGFSTKYKEVMPRIADCIWLSEWDKKKKVDWRKLCNGWKVHNLCVISSSDLYRLKWAFKPRSNSFFHNKFFIEKDRVVMDCAEEELIKKNIEEYHRDTDSV